VTSAPGGVRHVLVTGANRGLGLRTAQVLAEQGWSVLLACRRAETGREACEELRARGASAHVLELDVTDPVSVERAAAVTRTITDRLDALINNAGVQEELDEVLETSTAESGLRTLLINAAGPLLTTTAFLPLLRAAGTASIVNITSDWADFEEVDDGTFTAYRMSKAALNMLTANAAAALGRYGIVVNAVDPDWIPTDMGGPDATGSLEDAAALTAWTAGLRDVDGLTARLLVSRLLGAPKPSWNDRPPTGRDLLPQGLPTNVQRAAPVSAP
jgi:NAD(P)-dependent dehydrogenase (short-subunit alcohol dehydrogenase family)